MKKLKFQRPTGMHDILPSDQKKFQRIGKTVEEIAEFYGFGRIETPILEDAELFLKGVGVATDIVRKEMYTLKTKGGNLLALRPEGTAPIARAFIENGMMNRPQPIKLYYLGPFFRYERPQAGRYRQFWQFGFEVLGEKSSIADAQTIQIFHGILSDLKLKDIFIEINSIGDKECRPAYRRVLVRYLKSKAGSLCADCRKRTKENPLRALDCKNEKCKKIIEGAPQMIDYLCSECHDHFKKVLEYLDEIELPYQLNPYLARGLDYYTKTVFEFFAADPSGQKEKPLALGGGGRYDYLIKQLGGKEIPAVGGAFGMERIALLMEKENGSKAKTKIFLAQLGDLAKKKSLRIAEDFRKTKVSISESFGKDSLKGQMARASKIGARYTVIIGQREALEGTVIIRDMDTGKQEVVEADKAADKIKKLLKSQN